MVEQVEEEKHNLLELVEDDDENALEDMFFGGPSTSASNSTGSEMSGKQKK